MAKPPGFERARRRYSQAASPETDSRPTDYLLLSYRVTLADHRLCVKGGCVDNRTCNKMTNTRIEAGQCGYLEFTDPRSVWRVKCLMAGGSWFQ